MYGLSHDHIDFRLMFRRFATSSIPGFPAARPFETVLNVWVVHKVINVPVAIFVVVSPEVVIVIDLFLAFKIVSVNYRLQNRVGESKYLDAIYNHPYNLP
jgi:hypothetical protein